jgi:hypothetical protein
MHFTIEASGINLLRARSKHYAIAITYIPRGIGKPDFLNLPAKPVSLNFKQINQP